MHCAATNEASEWRLLLLNTGANTNLRVPIRVDTAGHATGVEDMAEHDTRGKLLSRVEISREDVMFSTRVEKAQAFMPEIKHVH
jgi:hypothetical protein